ncbi:MAG: tetratricopeptide repeat protein [Phycisphaeraceae bacterium]|nr:tetratricopeptide repeat protein [Phycisphaeraceae bacterium]
MAGVTDVADEWCDKGSTACDAGEFTLALECYDRAEACDSSCERVHYERGVTFERMGNSASAERAYRVCLERWPDHDMALSNLGSLLREQGKFDDALRQLDKAVKANPTREEAWFHKGMCHRSLRQFPQAASSLERAVKLNATDADDWHWLGGVLQDMDRVREALVCYAAARRFSIKPSQIPFLVQRSGMCGQRAATSAARPGPDAYRIPHLALLPKEHRRPVLQIIVSDFGNALQFLGPTGNVQAVQAVQGEIASLNQAIMAS